jgi:hypothetical protein
VTFAPRVQVVALKPAFAAWTVLLEPHLASIRVLLESCEYMRLAALGELPSTLTANERLEMLERDVGRLWEYIGH